MTTLLGGAAPFPLTRMRARGVHFVRAFLYYYVYRMHRVVGPPPPSVVRTIELTPASRVPHGLHSGSQYRARAARILPPPSCSPASPRFHS